MTLVSSPIILYFVRQALSLNLELTDSVWLAVQQDPGISCLWGYRHVPLCLALHVHGRVLNPGSQAYTGLSN